MKAKLALLSLVAIIGLAGFGCSGDSGNTTTTGDDLYSEYGGYSAADEAPAFGDAELAAAMGADPLVDDPAFPAVALDSLDSLRDVYALVLRWGQLEGDSTVTTPTDWDGSLEIEYGGIVLRQVIRFEPGQDYIVRPRTSRRLLEWVSQTSVHFDGLLVLVVDPPVDDDSVAGPNQLVLTLPQYTRTFSMAELENLAEIVPIDNLGNELAINARRLELTTCGEGPMDGIWRLNPSHRNGEFFGRWMNEDGAFGGHLKGHFGIRGDGSKVFFGKAIGVHGHFEGLLRGTWGFNDTDSTGGWYEGVWMSHVGLATGTVSGTWQSKTDDDDDDDDDGNGNGNGNGNGRGHGRGHDRNSRWGGGFFSGWWERACDADSTEDGA